MSNLKSKIFLGFMVVALALVVGVSSANAAYVHSMTLKRGMSGSQVLSLQQTLNVTPMTGYFGSLTKAAVMAFQSANMLVADGVVGPMTGAKLAGAGSTGGTYPEGCTSTAGYSSTTGKKCDGTDGGSTGGTTTLGTDEGDLTNLDEVSSSDSKLQEGKTSELFAFTADVEGDVKIDRVDFYLDSTAAGSQSENADDYFKSATLMVDGEEVKTLDVDNFDEDNYGKVDVVVGDSDEYRLRFSGLNLVFKDGDSPKFVLAFEGVSSIDGTDMTETWGVDMSTDSVRFVDGQGFSDTTGSASLEETFTPEAEDVAKLAIKTSSNDPEITTFEVSDSDETKDVTVFVFDIEEKNDVDVTVNDLTVTLTTTGTTDESAVVSSADLYKGSTLLGSESVPNGGVVDFTDLGLDISAGDSEEVTLKLTFADVDGYTEGTTVTSVLTSIDSAEDENGNDEGDMTISGEGLSSETHILRSTGISVDVTSKTTTINAVDGANNDIAEFTWVFDVTVFGDEDVYINKDVADIVDTSTAGDVDTLYSLEYSSGAVLTAQGGTLVESDNDVTSVTGDDTAYSAAYNGETFYKIASGTTGTLTLTVTGTNQTNAKQVRGLLNSIEWTTDQVDAATAEDASTATINGYTSNLGSDAATPFKSIN